MDFNSTGTLKNIAGSSIQLCHFVPAGTIKVKTPIQPKDGIDFTLLGVKKYDGLKRYFITIISIPTGTIKRKINKNH